MGIFSWSKVIRIIVVWFVQEHKNFTKYVTLGTWEEIKMRHRIKNGMTKNLKSEKIKHFTTYSFRAKHQ